MDDITFVSLTPSYAARVEAWSGQDAMEWLLKLPGTFMSTFLEQTQGWVALYRDEPVAVVTITHDESQVSYIRIAVKPSFQRQGIGHNLLQYAFEQPEARTLKPLYALVEPTNTAAQKIFSRAGFSQVGYAEDGRLEFEKH